MTRWLVTAFFAVAVLSGCEARLTLGGMCVRPSECTAPYACLAGRCREECVVNADCERGSECQPTLAGPRACTDDLCTTDGDCDPSWRCGDGRCRARCASEAECPTGSTCASAAGVRVCVRTEVDSGLLDAATIEGGADAPPNDGGTDATTFDAGTGAPDTSDPCFGRLDCDSDPTDCEAAVLTDPMRCGDCTRRCPVRPNATPACTLGACDVTCAPGFSNCDGDPTNGCEIESAIDELHCGSCTNVCPATDPACARGTCYPLPFPSDESDSIYHATANAVLAAGEYDFESFTIDPGVVVTTDGDGALTIRVSGAVSIEGTLDLRGGRGGAIGGGSCTPGGANGGGGATANALGFGAMATNSSTCRPAGGGGSGTAGDPAAGCGTGGMFGGGAGGGRGYGGGGGGGYAGGGGGGNEGSPIRPGAAGASAPSFGTGGAGGTTTGAPGEGGEPSLGPPLAGVTAPMSICGPGAGGGGSIGIAAAADLRVETFFRAGSGGGGGGGAGCSGGGGGGGGGGALILASATSITVAIGGAIRADGGAGNPGVATGNDMGGAGGGGGSGGAIYLSAPTLRVDGTVSALGGGGGGSSCVSSRGGAGGLGRVRLSTLADHCTLLGTWSHMFVSCEPTPGAGTGGGVYIDAYPF